jgi:hypothetical protein
VVSVRGGSACWQCAVRGGSAQCVVAVRVGSAQCVVAVRGGSAWWPVVAVTLLAMIVKAYDGNGGGGGAVGRARGHHTRRRLAKAVRRVFFLCRGGSVASTGVATASRRKRLGENVERIKFV